MDFQASEGKLKSKDTFVNAVVKAGTWIFYKDEDFNGTGNKADWVKFLDPGEHHQPISNFNGSVYLQPQQTEGIVLFEHFHFGGYRKCYNGNYDNVDRDFPEGHGGISSAIVLGGKFDVCVGPKGDGSRSTLPKGSYASAVEMNIGNDVVKSIRKLN